MTKTEYLTEYDQIVQTMQKYIDGSRQGKSELMRSAFHPDASFFGYAGEQLAIGTQFLFDWIDKNGPAPKIEPRIVSVDILDSIAVVRLEVSGWSGKLAGSGVGMFVGPVHASENTERLEDYPESVSLARHRTRRGSLVSGIVLRGVLRCQSGTLHRRLWNRGSRSLPTWTEVNEPCAAGRRVRGFLCTGREHEKQDIVFAFKHEIEAWSRLRTKCPEPLSVDEPDSLPAPKPPANAYLAEHDAITRTMHCYIAGARAGDSDLMRPAFHPAATISGYCQGVQYTGSVEHVFRWIDENGPASNINPRFARIEIIESIAVVHLEVQHWSGKLAGANARASDVFTLLKCNGEWKITHKLFHWHDR